MQEQQENKESSIRQKLSDYYYVTKPNVISLLVFTAAATYILASGPKPSLFPLIAVSASVWLGSAAANTVGSYFDRDIDLIMERTRSRPIPSQRIRAKNALIYGLVLLAVSIAISYALSPYSSLAMLIGFLDYAIVYSFVTKRRTWLNIILGGFSGVMPVLVGYFSVPSPVVSLDSALFLGFLVFFWIPEHIWSLAIHFRKDYSKAKVPMLPVILSERRSVQVIAVTTIIMIAYSLLPLYFSSLNLHIIYLAFAAVLGVVMFALNIWLLASPSAKRAWTVFKVSSPYLFFVFVGAMIDVLLRSSH